MSENSSSLPDRKFLSEFALNLYSARALAIPVSQLARSDAEMDALAAEISQRCHVYLIRRHPACSLDPAVFAYENQQITGSLVYRRTGKITTRPNALKSAGPISRGHGS
jgi:hypothetical protein